LRTLTIDRLEGIYAICEDENQKFFAIELSELPKGAKAGDVLSVNDEEGTLSVDAEASAARKKKTK
jgi:hypothetical protein